MYSTNSFISSNHKKLYLFLGLFIAYVFLVVVPTFAQSVSDAEYRAFPKIGSRNAAWIAAQLHLLFGSFILGVPMFAVIIEFIGVRTKDKRYDKMAQEFIKLCMAAFSTTALLGGVLVFILMICYPKVMNKMTGIFGPTMILYIFLFFGETFTLYLYSYAWDKMQNRKGWHLFLGVLLNVFGTAIMVVSNAWLTFQTSPAGVDEAGNFVGTTWQAVNNFTWMPINIHRLIGNVAFGGSIVGAYAAFRFLVAKTQEDKAHYDWMGYTGNFIALCGLIPLPFAGYWLGREIYMFNQTMGINMMGSLFSWLFIIQAVMIGVLFIGANYYLWSGMSRIEGAERYARYRPIMVTVIVIAKNTVVNIIILTTFLSFLFYRRSGKTPTAGWSKVGNILIALIFALAVSAIVIIGIAGFTVRSDVRVNILTPVQVLIALAVMISVTVIDLMMYRKAMSSGTIQWGKMTERSQYVLILLAITFTSLMGLMGYARSGLRENWHIFGVMPDTSAEAFTPRLGDAVNIIAIIMVIFFALVGFIFWIGLLGEKKKEADVHTEAQAVAEGGD
ncbi:cytochrome ubiquinol oxidase subunit I [Candidatus Poribacteria bacterium]|nr:cytochrome ubiquinol oxidase subunit I [Candidatus Poribacteria bacterium]